MRRNKFSVSLYMFHKSEKMHFFLLHKCILVTSQSIVMNGMSKNNFYENDILWIKINLISMLFLQRNFTCWLTGGINYNAIYIKLFFCIFSNVLFKICINMKTKSTQFQKKCTICFLHYDIVIDIQIRDIYPSFKSNSFATNNNF